MGSRACRNLAAGIALGFLLGAPTSSRVPLYPLRQPRQWLMAVVESRKATFARIAYSNGCAAGMGCSRRHRFLCSLCQWKAVDANAYVSLNRLGDSMTLALFAAGKKMLSEFLVRGKSYPERDGRGRGRLCG